MSAPASVATPVPHLIDSSVWIPVLRRNHPTGPALRARVAQVQGSGVAFTTEPVRFELLRGARDDANYERLAGVLGALPVLPVAAERWQEAGELAYRLLRRHGMQFPANDLLIACVAMAHGAKLVHRDRDFDLIARHAAVTVESHV
ncbi:MAG: hypothetical protein AVDCRST_MAG77-2405 [uncultured Chloroflexi bacterium]|uniref:Ribonuclease VapC n=1 Tax=uncultured Chloroflexota bacterium TaxID=166587 RepID=A0A6J4IRU9_9CHLR|nr:MAG: hypothetical protein AVDCRST_MAG77-2405 [uncultured Chloroflexota bacterium]